jgi:hypothetical protein
VKFIRCKVMQAQDAPFGPKLCQCKTGTFH